jgi:hypothetical protein
MSSEHEEITARVMQSLQEKPALNTPPLIAIDLGIEREEAERSLEELKAEGKVRQTVMGWKLPRTKV